MRDSGERLVRIQEVSGSNPLISTIDKDGKYCKILTVFIIIRAVEKSGFEGECAKD